MHCTKNVKLEFRGKLLPVDNDFFFFSKIPQNFVVDLIEFPEY